MEGARDAAEESRGADREAVAGFATLRASDSNSRNSSGFEVWVEIGNLVKTPEPFTFSFTANAGCNRQGGSQGCEVVQWGNYLRVTPLDAHRNPLSVAGFDTSWVPFDGSGFRGGAYAFTMPRATRFIRFEAQARAAA